MAGTSYTRQSTLTDGDTITAGLFNNEYNQIVSAFSYTTSGTTGHQHDGGAGEGGNIHTIGDQDFLNKIVVDTTNNRVGFFIEVGGSATEQIRVADGSVVPVTDNDVDLGSSSVQFKDLFLNGTANIDALVLTSGSTVTTILNEDNMSSDSDTALATQQSIKAYVDAQVTAQDLDLTDGTTVIAIDLDSETLSILGGTGITSTASGNGVTLAIDSTVTTLTGTQTLTNKTINADNNTIENLEVDNLKSGVLDTDISSVSSSDDTLPSAKAVKTYVDAQVTAQDVDITTDSGTIAIDLDSETLTISGGEGIDTSATGNAITIAGEDASTSNKGIASFVSDDFTVSSGAVSLATTSTAAELNLLDGATVTTAELNILDGVTSTTAELNILDGVTASAADINLIDGITNGTVIASKAIITDANKDITGGRNITITGELDAATLDISGNADIDGTLETDALSINGTTVTSTAAELNILDGVTATTAELNILDGVTSTAAELNILDGVTATATELNILDGVTTTTAELNFVDGVTSAIQTQLNAKAPLASPTFTGTVAAPTLNVSGNLTVSGTTTTLNTATLDVEDKNITLNYGSGDTSGSASGAGITIQDAVDATTDATILWDATNDEFDFSHPINVTGAIQGTSLNINGTAVTSTATELNILDGVTSTTAELNILDGVTATASELNILDGVTSTTAELNILDGVTATASELNILDGVTSTAAELNILDGVTATTAELNVLDGYTGSVTELNYLDTLHATGVTNTEFDYLDGVTSSIQTQLNAKGTGTVSSLSDLSVTATATELNIMDGVTATTAELNIIDGVTATTAELNKMDGVTATTAELNILDGVTATATELNKIDGVTATTTELNYVDGVTSAIQTQLNGKLSTSGGTVTGTLTVDGNLDLDDSDYLRFGSGHDVEMFTNGSHMYMDLNSGIGNFYIRDGTTTRFTFDDAGAFTATGNITAYSDLRLKENVEPITDALTKLDEISGNTYTRNDLKDTEKKYAGVIAQEIETVLPEAVVESEDGIKTVDYNATIALLIQAVKELKTEVKALKGSK